MAAPRRGIQKKFDKNALKTLPILLKYLFKYSNHNNELDKYAIFFYYLTHQITYDTKGINKSVTDLDQIFQSGKANNFQFCKLLHK